MCIRDRSQASHQRVHCGGVLNHLEASSRQAITNLVPLPCAASWAMDACRPHFAISTSLARYRTCVRLYAHPHIETRPIRKNVRERFVGLDTRAVRELDRRWRCAAKTQTLRRTAVTFPRIVACVPSMGE